MAKVIIHLNGRKYVRAYDHGRACLLPGCGARIPFGLDNKGRPESSDKYNRREGCCPSHGRKIQQMRIKRENKKKLAALAVNKFLYGG